MTSVLAVSLVNATVASSLLAPAVISDGVDPATCRLLGPFALVVQAVMGIVVISALLFKRAREKPRRKWRVWLADVSKQVVGQAFVHASNVAISDLLARRKKDNPCGLYLLNIAVDTTFGVFLLMIFLQFITLQLSSYQPESFKTGSYGNPFSIRIWCKQAAVYVLSLGLMKVVVVAFFWAVPGVFRAADWSLSWLANDEAQVLFVMLIFPVCMNILQFYIVDNILKSKVIDPALDPSRESFLSEGEDEDDDDEDANQPGYNSGRSIPRRSNTIAGDEIDEYSTLHDNATDLEQGRREDEGGESEGKRSRSDSAERKHQRMMSDEDEYEMVDGDRTPTMATYPPSLSHPSSRSRISPSSPISPPSTAAATASLRDSAPTYDSLDRATAKAGSLGGGDAASKRNGTTADLDEDSSSFNGWGLSTESVNEQEDAVITDDKLEEFDGYNKRLLMNHV